MMEWMFIVNPVAGKGMGREIAQHIQQFMKDKNISYDIRYTGYRGDGETIARQAVQRGCSKIIAVGGDGTIYEVINGLAGGTAVLGIIPCGTGNDFVKTLGLPEKPEKALKVILEGERKTIDCGRLNSRYFLNVASVGLDAEIVKETESIKKYIKGPSAYMVGVLKTLIHFHYKEVILHIDGVEMKKKVMLIAVANGRYYGGGMKIAPQAEIEDGYFDICIVNKVPKGKLLRLFPTIFSGKHQMIDEVEMLKGKHIKIFSEEQLMINVDGDIIGETPVTMEILSKFIDVLVPRKV